MRADESLLKAWIKRSTHPEISVSFEINVHSIVIYLLNMTKFGQDGHDLEQGQSRPDSSRPDSSQSLTIVASDEQSEKDNQSKDRTSLFRRLHRRFQKLNWSMLSCSSKSTEAAGSSTPAGLDDIEIRTCESICQIWLHTQR